MSTVVASQSLADSATLTSSSFPFDPTAVVIATITNGGTPPSQFCQVALQISTDNATWIEVDKRWGLSGSSAASIQVFELSNYAGNSGTAFMNGYNSTTAPTNFRLVFSGNVGAAVTVAANSSVAAAVATVPLVGVLATTGGAVGVWKPPQGGTGIVVTRVIANITTPSTGAANLTAGVAATSTTSSNNMITASDVHSAAVVLDSQALSGVPAAMVALGAVTFTGSASTVGLVGTGFISYYPAP